MERQTMPSYTISLINCGTEETRTNNDLIVVKGVVELEDGVGEMRHNENSSDSGEDDDGVSSNWSREIQIIQNSTTPVPFKSDGKAFIFVATLAPGTNTFDFVSKEDANTSYKTLIFVYEPPEIGASAPVRSVIPMLILCADEEQPEALIESTSALIRLGLKLCQAFFEEKLMEHGLDKRSFHVSSDVEILTLDFLTMHKLSRTSAEKVWEIVACQIKASDKLWNPLNKYVAFLFESCRLVTDSLAPKTADKLACGGGGLALIGFNSFPTWPKDSNSVLDAVFSQTKLLAHPLLEMTVYLGHLNNTAGSLYCAAIGAVAHELGHIFDLGHSDRGLMGTDFYRFDQFLTPVPKLNIDCFGCSKPVFTRRGSGRAKKMVITLTHSSAKILAFHKWFMCSHDVDVSDQRPTLIKNKIVSNFPLHVVEMRHIDNGMVLREFEFSNSANPCELLLSKRDIPVGCGDVGVVIAQDSKGNLLKATVARIDLPNTFTTINPQGN